MTTELLEKPNQETVVFESRLDPFPARIFEFHKLERNAELAATGRTYNDYYAAVEYMIRLRRAARDTNQEDRFDQLLDEFKLRHRFKTTLIKLLNSKVEAFSV